MTTNKHKQVRKRFGAIRQSFLGKDIDVSSSLTVLANYTQRVLGRFSLKTSSFLYYFNQLRERKREIIMGKKRQIETCNVCGHKNDLTVIFENGDFEPSWREGYVLIYCEECGNTIEVRKR